MKTGTPVLIPIRLNREYDVNAQLYRRWLLQNLA